MNTKPKNIRTKILNEVFESVKGWFAKVPDTWENHVLPHEPLEQLADNIWIIKGTLKRGPPRNMVIYKMNNGGLWIHSCIAVNEVTLNAILALGNPEILLVPNGFHRIDCKVWKEKFPEIKVVSPASAKAKVEEVIKVDHTVEEIAADLQQNGITLTQAQGMRLAEITYILDIAPNRHAFVVCDLLFNLAPDTGVIAWLIGSTGDGVVPKISGLTRLFGVADKTLFKRWFSEDFLPRTTDADLLLVGHGNVVRDGLNSKLQQTLANYK